MENRAYALAAGAFVLILGSALLAALWWFGEPREQRSTYLLVSRGNITGLNLEAQVRFRGIRAGKVEAIGIDPADPANILVRISLSSELPVTRATRASLAYQGVTGLAYVQLEDSGSEREPLISESGEPPRIALQPGLLDRASESALLTLERVQLVSERLAAVLSEDNVKHIERTLARLDSASGHIDRSFARAPATLAAIEQAFGPAQIARVQSVLTKFEAAGDEATPAIREFRQLMDRLDTGAQSFDQFARNASQGLMSGTLPRLNALLRELTETSRQISTLFREVEAAPQMLLLGRGRQLPGPGESGYEVSPVPPGVEEGVGR